MRFFYFGSRKVKAFTERTQVRTFPIREIKRSIEDKDDTAAILGLNPSTLRARIKKLGILRPETKEPD